MKTSRKKSVAAITRKDLAQANAALVSIRKKVAIWERKLKSQVAAVKTAFDATFPLAPGNAAKPTGKPQRLTFQFVIPFSALSQKKPGTFKLRRVPTKGSRGH